MVWENAEEGSGGDALKGGGDEHGGDGAWDDECYGEDVGV